MLLRYIMLVRMVVLIAINDKEQLCREEESFNLLHKSMFCGDMTLDGTLMLYP